MFISFVKIKFNNLLYKVGGNMYKINMISVHLIFMLI